MTSTNRVKVKADLNNNILFLTVSGRFSKKEIESLYTDIRFTVSDLKPGFNVIADYSQCNLLYLSSLPAMQNIIKYLSENGLGKTIRVVNKNAVLFRQLLKFTDRIKGHSPVYVASVDQALKILTDENIRIQRRGERVRIPEQKVIITAAGNKFSAKIDNISISGCAITCTTAQVSLYDLICLQLFYDSGSITEDLGLKATVVRVRDDSFAVEFFKLDSTLKNQLDCILQDAEKTISA